MLEIVWVRTRAGRVCLSELAGFVCGFIHADRIGAAPAPAKPKTSAAFRQMHRTWWALVASTEANPVHRRAMLLDRKHGAGKREGDIGPPTGCPLGLGGGGGWRRRGRVLRVVGGDRAGVDHLDRRPAKVKGCKAEAISRYTRRPQAAVMDRSG